MLVKIKDNIGSEHYHRFKEDISLMEERGFTATNLNILNTFN